MVKRRAVALALPISVAVAAACRGPSPRVDPPAAVQVVCPVGRVDPDCFRRASERCGRAGYDLFDRTGRPATVADAEFGALEARCRR